MDFATLEPLRQLRSAFPRAVSPPMDREPLLERALAG